MAGTPVPSRTARADALRPQLAAARTRDGLSWKRLADEVGGVSQQRLHAFVVKGEVPVDDTLDRIEAWLNRSETPGEIEGEDAADLAAAMEVTQQLASGYRNDPVRDPAKVAASARTIAAGLRGRGRRYVEGWIEMFLATNENAQPDESD